MLCGLYVRSAMAETWVVFCLPATVTRAAVNILLLVFAFGVGWTDALISLRSAARTGAVTSCGRHMFSPHRYNFAVVLYIFVAMSIQHDCAHCYVFSVDWSFYHSVMSLSASGNFLHSEVYIIYLINIVLLSLEKKNKFSLVTIIRKRYANTLQWRYMIIKIFRHQFRRIYWKMYIHAHWPSDFNYRNLSLKKNNYTRAQKSWMYRMLIAALFITVKRNRSNPNGHQ